MFLYTQLLAQQLFQFSSTTNMEQGLGWWVQLAHIEIGVPPMKVALSPVRGAFSGANIQKDVAKASGQHSAPARSASSQENRDLYSNRHGEQAVFRMLVIDQTSLRLFIWFKGHW